MSRMVLGKTRPVLIHVYSVLFSVGRVCFEKGKSTFALFVDFKNVFDCVNCDLYQWKITAVKTI